MRRVAAFDGGLMALVVFLIVGVGVGQPAFPLISSSTGLGKRVSKSKTLAQVGVTLELSDAKAPDKVKVYMPAIRSGVLMLISQRTAEELLLREGKEKLAADILEEAAGLVDLDDRGCHTPAGLGVAV